jgi:predicted nuclease of predicted toxin-antitoxin system
VKVLFDHNLPHNLRTSLARASTHEFVTASFLGWGRLENGELLEAAEDAAFEVFVTGDRTLVREQNLSARRISIIALSTNNWPIVKNSLPQILAAIDRAVPGEFAEVDCGEFSRKKPAEQPGSTT